MESNASRERFAVILAAALVFFGPVACGSRPPSSSIRSPTPLPSSTRLYVFDCGTLHIADTRRFRLDREEVSGSDLSVACFLITNPKGALIWDAGAVPDGAWAPADAPIVHHIVLPDSQERDVSMRRALLPQLRDAGYTPADITYLALSHYHYDHTANANAFASATWLVRQPERDAMFARAPPGVSQPTTYAALRTSKTHIIRDGDYDVFGDATVVIKAAPGHTPGHQILYVKLKKTGDVVLSGDLYHYPEARRLKRVPVFDYDQVQSRATREAIEAFLAKTGAQLWIQHDLKGNARLKKAPEFYE